MSFESPNFFITPETTDAVMDTASDSTDVGDYASTVAENILVQQTPLYDYLAESSIQQKEHGFMYGLAAALSFDVFTKELEKRNIVIALTSENIVVHKISSEQTFSDSRFQDDTWVTERITTVDATNVDSNIGFFLNVVNTIAPEFRECMKEFATAEDISPKKRLSVLKGFYDGFMPLYVKIKMVGEQTVVE